MAQASRLCLHHLHFCYNTPVLTRDVLSLADSSRAWVAASRRRALGALLTFALGLILADHFAAPAAPWAFAFALVLALVAAFAPARVAPPLLAAALFAFALGWYDLRIRKPQSSPLWRTLAESPPPLLTVDGTVLDSPQFIPRPRDGLAQFRVRTGHHRFTLAVTDALTDDGPVPLNADLLIRSEHEVTLHAGDRIRITGVYHPTNQARNPGDLDPRALAAQQGVLGTLSITGPGVISPSDLPASLTSRGFSAFLAARDAVASRARAVLTRAAGDNDQSRALLLGLILGDFDPAQQPVRSAFARQGLAHVLSISGLHLGVMALVLLVLLRLTGDRGWLEPALVAILVLGYLAIVPPNSPVVRSAIMILALLLAEALGRRYDRLTILLWIGLGLLLWRPLDVYSIGFQLSLGLTACLFWLGNRALAHLFRRPLKGVLRGPPSFAVQLKDHAKLALACGLLCWTASLPATIYTLGYLSPWSLVATLLITPLILAMLWVGYVALWAGLLWPALASGASIFIDTLARLSVAGVQTLDRLPGATIYLPPVSGLWAAASTLCVLLAWRLPRPARAWWWCIILLPFAWAGAEWALPRPASVLTITTFDVGDGSSHLITSGSDTLLWDSGSIGEGRLMNPTVRACRAAGGWRVPLAVITHPDIDHFGAILDVAGPLGIRRVLVPPRFLSQAHDEPRGAAALALADLTRRGIDVAPITSGDELTLGHCRVRFVSPPPDAAWKNDNDHSLIALITAPTAAGETTLMLTGDAQDDALNALAATLPFGFHPDILELPHHGSARPAALRFVASLAPRLIIQSTGSRRLNDPRWNTVRDHTTWMCTADLGAITTRVTPQGTIITQGALAPAPTTLAPAVTNSPAPRSPHGSSRP